MLAKAIYTEIEQAVVVINTTVSKTTQSWHCDLQIHSLQNFVLDSQNLLQQILENFNFEKMSSLGQSTLPGIWKNHFPSIPLQTKPVTFTIILIGRFPKEQWWDSQRHLPMWYMFSRSFIYSQRDTTSHTINLQVKQKFISVYYSWYILVF